MNDQIILKAIDDSIKKWRRIVFTGAPENRSRKPSAYTRCPLCELFNDNCENHNSPCKATNGLKCPIFYFTGRAVCIKTSFYMTSVWAKSRGLDVTKIYRVHDNHMLTELYDIRRRFIEALCDGGYV